MITMFLALPLTMVTFICPKVTLHHAHSTHLVAMVVICISIPIILSFLYLHLDFHQTEFAYFWAVAHVVDVVTSTSRARISCCAGLKKICV
jgi:hypothetical protein